ncbi:uncharacterized protein Bfra_003597 [Botrytis fragariae]|uniref:Uncharacterized protein n=1 Tax=Botrytis fragariae TaxID=1964551 RepID=A0A8H6EK44_9HELO|nr:uncharacterized protein Bfra_003597 [Botrytis fragariae]KAF5875144.1 hypothetical protein Bfra_003597 [Botrytis fragariae]
MCQFQARGQHQNSGRRFFRQVRQANGKLHAILIGHSSR